MEGAPVTMFERRDVGHRHVADVEHVAGLVPIAVDGDRLALDHPARKDGDHATFLGDKVLPRTVDVGVAKRGVAKVERPLKGAEVLLERELARAVRGERPDWMVFIRRHDVGLAVERAAGGAEDHLGHPAVDACA